MLSKLSVNILEDEYLRQVENAEMLARGVKSAEMSYEKAVENYHKADQDLKRLGTDIRDSGGVTDVETIRARQPLYKRCAPRRE